MFGRTKDPTQSFPQWLRPLGDPAAPEPWRWLEPLKSKQKPAIAQNDAQEVKRYTKALAKRAQQRAKRSVVVGSGAQVLDRVGGGTYAESYLVFDPDEPD